MSGRRVLDFIALTQAASAVARKTIRLQGLSVPSNPGYLAPDARAAPWKEDSSAQERTSLASASHESALSSNQNVSKDQTEQRKSTTTQAGVKQQNGRDQEVVKSTFDGLQGSNDPPGLTKSATTSRIPGSESPTTEDLRLSQRFGNQRDEPSQAGEAALPDQDLGPLYSELFHSPRSASLLHEKPKRPSAWANIEFRKPSQLGPSLADGSVKQGTTDNRIRRESLVPLSAKDLASNASDPSGKGPISQGKEREPVGHRTTSTTETTDPPKVFVEETPAEQTFDTPSQRKYEMRESKVPSTRLGRIWQYSGLATSLAFGAAGEGLRRSFGGNKTDGRSLVLSDSNMEAIVSKLSRMRGAALKLGQMISFQDLKMLPAPISEVLQRVQDSADFMPAWQRNKVLQNNLGSDWRELFTDFEEKPIAAASIGQVHAATLKSNGEPVAVKIQYPGVADSIDSDLNNLALLLTASRLLPKGLYLDKTIANARTELAWECDYIREGEAAAHFSSLLSDDTDVFTVPKFIDSTSGPQVLTLERMYGVAVTKIPGLSQDERNWIATNILRLCLRELFEFRYMQTDPNWTNFLFNQKSRKLELLDFGASREFPASFTDPYCRILLSAAKGDRKSIADLSVELGYLTGHESRTMRDAHVDSVLTLAEPFADSSPDLYDFRDQTITDRVRALIPVMLRERLAPPPEETYSLHRKLSGAFLLCARLGSQVAAKDLFNSAVDRWKPIIQ